jgi:hypothetical protein
MSNIRSRERAKQGRAQQHRARLGLCGSLSSIGSATGCGGESLWTMTWCWRTSDENMASSEPMLHVRTMAVGGCVDLVSRPLHRAMPASPRESPRAS